MDTRLLSEGSGSAECRLPMNEPESTEVAVPIRALATAMWRCMCPDRSLPVGRSELRARLAMCLGARQFQCRSQDFRVPFTRHVTSGVVAAVHVLSRVQRAPVM